MSYSRVDKFIRESGKLDSLKNANILRDQDINIVIGKDNESGKISVMTYTAVGLALRCFNGHINIFYDKEPIGLSHIAKPFFESLLDQVKEYGDKQQIQFKKGKPKDGIILSLGTDFPGAVSADAAGWNIGINQTFPSEINASPPAAIFSVCCSFAKLFNSSILNNAKHLEEKWTLSLLDFSHSPEIPNQFEIPYIDFGTIGLLGGGAIGSGFAYSLLLSGWCATMDIIDMDRYDQENLETTMLLKKVTALKREHKAKALASLLNENEPLSTNPIVTELSADSIEIPKKRNIFISAVDNAKTRCLLDNVNADILLNGAVGGSKKDAGHVLFSRHLSTDLPLSELYQNITDETSNLDDYPEEVKSDKCSRIDYNEVSMAAPFLGLASGTLLLMGCVRYSLGIELNESYAKFDLLKWQQKFQTKRRFLIV